MILGFVITILIFGFLMLLLHLPDAYDRRYHRPKEQMLSYGDQCVITLDTVTVVVVPKWETPKAFLRLYGYVERQDWPETKHNRLLGPEPTREGLLFQSLEPGHVTCFPFSSFVGKKRRGYRLALTLNQKEIGPESSLKVSLWRSAY